MIELIKIDPELKVGAAFAERDIEFFSNHKGLEKSNEIFHRIGYDTPIYINARDHEDAHSMVFPQCSGRWEYHERHLGIKLPDHCLVVATNITSPKNWMPLTAWIIVHRHHHGMLFELYESTGDLKKAIGFGVDSSFDCIVALEKEIAHLIEKPFFAGDYCSPTEYTHRMLTTGAGRRGDVSPRSFDVAAELYAQLVFKGHIEFAPPEDWHCDSVRNEYTSWTRYLSKELVLDNRDELLEVTDRYRPLIQKALEREREIMMNGRFIC